jgi:hypothetical protein
MVEVVVVVLDFLEVQVQAVQLHKVLQVVHQILVVEDLVAEVVRVLLVRMGNSLQTREMEEQVPQIPFQEVQ